MDDGQKTVLDCIQEREAAGRRGMPTFCCWFPAANQQQQPQPQKVSVPTPLEQQPMESVSTPQQLIQPQEGPQQPQKKVSVTPQTQQQQQQFQQKVSVSPTIQAQAQQQYKVSDAPPKTEPQPQQQSETLVNPSVREKGTIPSGVVNLPTPKEDADVLYRAFTGRGCDVGRLKRVFAQRDATHRHLIEQHFRKNYGEELSDRIQWSTPEEDGANLYRAFKGRGCDLERLLQILTKCDATHRHLIQQHYKKNYGEDLIERICSELSSLGDLKEKVGIDLTVNPTGTLGRTFSSNIKRAVSLWMLEESERDATIVWQAMQKTSLDRAAVTEVICSRTPSQLSNIQRAYHTKFSSPLSQEINSSIFFSVSHKELSIACLDSQARDEGTNVDLKMAEEDAKQLYEDGEKRWGTNKRTEKRWGTIIDIFTKRNRPHLVAVDAAYHKLYGHSLEKAVEKESTVRDFKTGLLTLLSCAKNPAKYFAEVLYNAMKGVRTSDTTLIRTLVTRAGIDMEDVKKEYAKAYKKSLKDVIQWETSGGYRTFLISLVE